MSKTKTVPIGATALVLILAVVLNPSPESHRTKMKEVIADRSPIEGLLGVGVLTAMASTYHSLGVASYTTVNDKTITVGAFGLVFLVR